VFWFVNGLFLTYFRTPLPQGGVISRFFRFAVLLTGYKVYNTNAVFATTFFIFPNLFSQGPKAVIFEAISSPLTGNCFPLLYEGKSPNCQPGNEISPG